MMNNDTIQNELSNILDRTFKIKSGNNHFPSENLNISEMESEEDGTEEEPIQEKEEPTKNQTTILLMEEGGKEREIKIEANRQPNSIHSLNSNNDGLALLLKNQSVFSDLNNGVNNSYNRSSIYHFINSKKQQHFASTTQWRNQKLGIVNENANAGNPPPISHSIWGTVKNWLQKAAQNIRQMTTNFLSNFGKNIKSILIEFGILVLAFSVLFSAGYISDPSPHFKSLFSALLSFFK